ncbi:hypothetical protein OF83DRAFT_1180024 [Amylostereum chailletii]|nr:hypothetical protein OF83DRAFT_1180024 [Amylostereum chailletii]
MDFAYLLECTTPTVPEDAPLKQFMLSRQHRRQLRDKECYKCSNCGIWKRSTQLKICSGCKSLKGRYCSAVCQRAHWSSHKATCLSIRAASHEAHTVIHLIERALVVPQILMGLKVIMIRELKIGTSSSIGLNHAMKVVCGLTSTDLHTNVHQLVHGEPAMAGEECCLTFLSFTPVPLDSIPATCYTQVCPSGEGTPVTLWFVAEELGDTRSLTNSLLDLSFAVTWSVSSSSIINGPTYVPEHPLLDGLRYGTNRYIRLDENNNLSLRTSR